jgi:hypothetical protein
MCQDDLGPRTVLTPFEDCVTDELTRGNPDTAAAQAALRYARRVERLAMVLHDLLDALDHDALTGQSVLQARAVLIQESVAAARGEEAV